MSSSKDWFPKFGFSRRNNNAFINFVTFPSGRKRLLVKEVVINPDKIVGEAVGQLHHTAGVVLVAAPGAKFVLQFITALVIYDYDTAVYGGFSGNLKIRSGTTEVAPSITTIPLESVNEDKIIMVNASENEEISANETLNLYRSQACTQPGTAAGIIRVHLIYLLHPTGL